MISWIPDRILPIVASTLFGIIIPVPTNRVEAGTMIILRCRTCNGTGEVTNEQFRICQALKSHATKRYFHLPMDEEAGDEREQPQHDACNSVPEKVECPVCEGAGEIAFDEEDWDLKIVADEDEHLEE